MFDSVNSKKIDKNIIKGIDHIIQRCGKINTKDKVLILYDKKTQSLANLFELRSSKISKKVISLFVNNISRHGQEPDIEIANEMLNSSIILSLCSWSLAHTNARIKAATAGARFLSLPNYSIDFITNPEKIRKIRYVCDRYNQLLLRVDKGDSCNRIKMEGVLVGVEWDTYDAVVISDYDKGFLDESTIQYISKQHDVTFLDTKKPLNDWASGIKFIKIICNFYFCSNPICTSNYFRIFYIFWDI